MSDEEFYRGNPVAKFLGQSGSFAQLGAIIALISGEYLWAVILFIGGLIALFIGYLISGGASNPHL